MTDESLGSAGAFSYCWAAVGYEEVTASVESARMQLEWNEPDLESATWAEQPRDLEELRTLIGDATALHGLYFTIFADPELEGFGVRLVWADEWPDSWS